jgi:hypothetical protein
MEAKGMRDEVLSFVKPLIEKQFERELEQLSKLLQLLGLSVSVEKLIEYSGLTFSSYSVKGHTYLKLMAVLTGEKSNKVEELLIRKEGEKRGKKMRLRKKSFHLLNLKDTEENRANLNWLVHYWRRAKALKRWLDEVERVESE